MGVCFSSKVKTSGSPYHSGSNFKYVSRDASETSSSGSGQAPTLRSEGEILQASNLKNFTFADLKLATRNFRTDSVLGEGGFGSVYKGWIDEHTLAACKPGSGMVIAVKRLNLESYQGHREWLAEVNFLGQLHHPNLVKLIGYCLEDEHRLLVYEFMPRGSLENHLFRRGSYFQPLSWNLRLKVAIEAAKGLAFLHSPEAKVIYRDFKASNILLDSKYTAKLSDFGLAKDGPTGDKSHVSTRVMGTFGYAAPEYMATGSLPYEKAIFVIKKLGHLTARSDVYSFGVVLLEMLSGLRAVDKNRPPGQISLVEWAKPYLANKRKVFRALDSRMQGQYTLEAAHKAATLALRCLSTEPKFRPSMDQVVKLLEELKDPKETIHAQTKSASGTSRRRRTTEDAALPKSANGARNHRKSEGGVAQTKYTVAYPRPSASPLYK